MPKPNFKQLAKVLGGSFFMGIGAFAMGNAFVLVWENVTGEPIDASTANK